jgi:5-methylcytosine-specific restriction endonuclease McrA
MTQVLLLNATYEPLGAVNLPRAIRLWLTGRVEPACADCVSVTSPTSSLDIPQVLRLKVYVNVPNRRAALWSRYGLFARDDFRCAYCGRKLPVVQLTVDHVVPRSDGGKTSWGNTVTCCGPCNQRKGDREPHAAGMKLLIEPKTPRVSYLLARGEVPTAWKLWIEL